MVSANEMGQLPINAVHLNSSFRVPDLSGPGVYVLDETRRKNIPCGGTP
jgi:hypothetical protein